MNMTIVRSTFVLIGLGFGLPSHAFLGGLTDALKKAQPTSGGQKASPDSSRTSYAKDSFNSICKQALGAPFKEKPLSAPVDQVVGKYFKLSTDMEARLATGINRSYNGTIVNLSRHIADIKEESIQKLAEAYVANPSMAMLAQIVEYSENGDAYADGDMPSEKIEAQTLLAMVMMQYPELVIRRELPAELLRKTSISNSGLGTALIARAHLYGDYAKKDINTFNNYIGRASSNYPVKIADQSIFYALKNIPNWQPRRMYEDLLKQSQDFYKDFNRQRDAAKSTDLNKRALVLMAQGKRIDELTLEALGAGPRMAEIRAKAEMLKKDGAGEANLIMVAANQSESFKAEVNAMLAKNPQLDDQAKKKLADANKLMLENLNGMKAITVELTLKFFSGDFGGTAESGQYINRYFRNACSVGSRTIELAKQAGVPSPQLPPSTLAKDL